MLEVCFSDSVKGALALAQHCEKDVIGGTVFFFTDKKGLPAFFAKRKAKKEFMRKQLEDQKHAVPLGGRPEDIVGLSLGLSEGDIQSPIDLAGCPRKEYLRSTLFFDRYNEREDMSAALDEFWTGCVEDLQKLKSNASPIRVWLDDTPDAQCGLLFVADLLKNSNVEIHTVELPQKTMQEDHVVVEYRGWGDVEPQRYGTFLDREKTLTEREVAELANRWERLKSENSPLRVVENGSVVSADMDYYDDLIRREFPRDSCRIAFIIGSAMKKQRILTGDAFLAKRIQHFIDTGELRVSSKAKDGFYRTVVRCAK